MADTTAIEWTDATVNFWWGCTKVGPGCDHCYAEAWDKRTGGAHFGTGVPRRKIKSAVKTLHRLDNDYSEWAADAFCARSNAPIFGLPMPTIGDRQRVFIQSMSDLFDNEVPLEWFQEAWDTICRCDRLDIQLVTKRISMVEKRFTAGHIHTNWPKHAGLIVTVVNQAEADRDVPRLLALKAKLGIPWVGLSVEPMLTAMDIRWALSRNPLEIAGGILSRGMFSPGAEKLRGIDWVICGGESGPHARAMHPDWARSLRDQCVAVGVPFLFKQWGEWAIGIDRDRDDPDWRCDYSHKFSDGGHRKWLNLAGGSGFHGDRFHVMRRIGKKAAGRILDGAEWSQFPEVSA